MEWHREQSGMRFRQIGYARSAALARMNFHRNNNKKEAGGHPSVSFLLNNDEKIHCSIFS